MSEDNKLSKVEQALQKIQNKSLLSKVQDMKAKVNRMKEYEKLKLLCDVSGSMGSYVGEDYSMRAIDVLNHILKDFEGATVYKFSDHCAKVPTGSTLTTEGGTNLAGGLRTVKNAGLTEVILITDGKPDSEQAALNEAKGLKINIIYIGPEPRPPFLEKLAKHSGGKFENIELITKGAVQGAAEIESKIRGFLGDGK